MSSNKIPSGGLVLVTGANGYLASVLIKKLIEHGYFVRGSVRSAVKHQWMLSHYGPKFSLVEVPDFAVPGSFDTAVKGVDGIAHVASSVSFSTDPHTFIPPVVAGAVNVLKSAAKEPKVKSVVYTSSNTACIPYMGGKPYSLNKDTWNDYAVEKVYDKSWAADDLTRMMMVYCASKTEAEKASWTWVQENKPHFSFNAIIPNLNIGIVISPKNTGFPSSAAALRQLFHGNTMGAKVAPPQWYVDVEDTGLLHIAALTMEDVNNERLFAMAGKYDWNQILGIFRKLYPERKFIEDFEDGPKDQGTVENQWSVDLLKRLGKDGWTSLEDTVAKALHCVVEAEAYADEIPKGELENLENHLK